MERAHFDQSHRLNEKKVTLKRRYTENHPALTAGKDARIRNKMLEAIADGSLTQEEFNQILSELSTDSARWMKRNSRYFNVSEDGITLSKFGSRILNQIKINENNQMKNDFVFESFSEFIGSLNENTEMINEGTRGQFGIIDKKGNIQSVYTHYDSYPEYMLPTIKKNYKNSKAVQSVLAKGDNSGLDALDKMNFYNDGRAPMAGKKSNIDSYIKLAANDGGAEYIYLYDESDKKWYMVDVYGDRKLVPAFESVVNEENEQLFEAEVEMDAMDPDNKDFLKFLKKNRVKIIGKTMDGPGGGHPVITMQGKRKDLEAVLADCDYGWCDEELAEYIEESVQIVEEFRPLNEAFKSSKLQNLVNMDQSGSDAYGKAGKLAQAIYGLSKIKLDQVEDSALVDTDPMTAYKTYANNKDYIVFYIVDNEKENPYADSNRFRSSNLKPGILAVSKAKEFLGVHYDSRGSRGYSDARGKKSAYTLGTDSGSAVGGNKNYKGYDASGISSIKRAADLADRAIVFSLVSGGESSRELIQQRSDAQSGAIAFKSAADFKKANQQRYKDILATKASKLPLDKMVEDAINDLTNHIASALKSGEKTKYGEIKIGEDSRGREIKLTDASNMMSGILSDYDRYVSYMVNAEKEKEQGYSSGYYEREAKQYAKYVSDKVKKIKDMDYAW